MTRARLILASHSPRRMALLAQIGVVPDLQLGSDVLEEPLKDETPRLHALRLAREKAQAVVNRSEAQNAYVLAADTVVAVGRRILPKAEMLEEAERCLRLLSGRTHRVWTAVVLVMPDGKRRERIVETRVAFKRLDETEIKAYLASCEWHGKAAGYAIQGLAAAYVTHLIGSYSNVVGLPLSETYGLLKDILF